MSPTTQPSGAVRAGLFVLAAAASLPAAEP